MSTAPFKHIYLVDGSGYIFRAFFALPPMTRADGTPVNAVFGFTKMLMKLVADSDADALAVIFDKGRTTFRNDIYPDYKAHRPEAPEELVPQFSLIREATEAYNLPAVEMEGYEADDLIATYAREARAFGAEVTIVSSDKDLMQLVDDGITMLDPMKNRIVGHDQVVEKFGVGPEKVVDVQALAGDSTDNVPGVPGIGIKTAAQLINEYGSLETLLARADEIKQPKRREKLVENAELARVSKQLVTLRQDVPVAVPVAEFVLKKPDPEILRQFLEENTFKSILAQLASELGIESETGADPRRPAEVGYSLVQDEESLQSWIDEAFECGIVAVDTETTSLDAMQASLVGVSLSTKPGRACYIPLRHKAGGGGVESGTLALEETAPAPEQLDPARAIELLKPLLESDAVLKAGQNIKYDMLVLGREGIHVGPIDDTMLLSYVIDAGLHGHGMDELSRLHLDHETIKFSEVAGSGKNQVTFDKVPLDKALDYAAEDADITLRLHQVLKGQILAERLVTVYETMERPLVPVLAEMERTGIKVDKDILRRMSNDFAGRIAELEAEIHSLAGRSFTIGSPKQLGEILFDEMGLKGGKKGKSGAYATGHDVLQALVAEGHDFPARVLDWRQLTKLKSTYTDALQTQINPETGRVHTSYSQAIASTGRLSSNDPNLQNIPVRTEEGRKIRTAFIAEKGCRLLSVDYSQIELRLAAEICEEEALKEAFRDGQDIHAITASQVFGVPVDGMDPMVRRQAKAINFGIIYGISAFGLAQNLGIAQSEARAFIETYFNRYPGIKAYMERTKKEARERGFVRTLFGRKIHVSGIADKNPARRNFSERAAINAPIQGTAADIIKRAMVRIPAALGEAGLKAKMLLQVHDELLFEVPEDELDKTSGLVRGVMEGAAEPVLKLSIPLTADAGIGDNWAEAH
ncbi:MAG: DNA polymerase I [Kiloniellales bacterium]|nr:DNA polymerase I [Kiloniellales bacterium]